MARHTFGGDHRYLSWMFDLVMDHLYMTFFNKISGNRLEQWIPSYVHHCRHFIHSALRDEAPHELEYIDGEVQHETLVVHHFGLDSFCIFGFLDEPTACPGTSATRHESFQHDVQQAFYSGYLKQYRLKAQIVYLPIGLIGCVFITELRQNDNEVQILVDSTIILWNFWLEFLLVAFFHVYTVMAFFVS